MLPFERSSRSSWFPSFGTLDRLPPSGGRDRETVKIGLLYSLSGAMAVREAPLLESALMAIAHVNQAGGVLGRSIEPVVEDGSSDPHFFYSQAQKLFEVDGVTAAFGGGSSAARKAIAAPAGNGGRASVVSVYLRGFGKPRAHFLRGLLSEPARGTDFAMAGAAVQPASGFPGKRHPIFACCLSLAARSPAIQCGDRGRKLRCFRRSPFRTRFRSLAIPRDRMWRSFP